MSEQISLNDLRFVNAYEAYGFKSPSHIDAYKQIHPNCKRSSAIICAARLLNKVSVQAEIRLRLEATKAVTVEALAACLLKYRQWAEEKSDYTAATNICMDQAKLAGFLIERTQDLTDTPTVSTKQVEDELVRRGLVTVPVN